MAIQKIRGFGDFGDADMDQQLSEHFTLGDLCITSTGLPNIPNDTQIASLTQLAAKLEELMLYIGPFNIVSAFRAPAVQSYLQTDGTVSEQAQAATNSYHELGIAADIQPVNMTATQAFATIASNDPLKNSLGEIALKDNVIHLSLATSAKQGVLMKVIDNNYIRMTADEIADIISENQVAAGIGGGVLILGIAFGVFVYLKKRRLRNQTP